MGRIILQKEITGSSVYTGKYINDYQDSIQLMTCNDFTAEQMHVLFSEKKLVIAKDQYSVSYKLIDNGKEECPYCDAEDDKDIFFNWLPAMFGLEKEDHDYNPDVTVFITAKAELELCVMMCDDYLVKEKKKINFCPFCGRRLQND